MSGQKKDFKVGDEVCVVCGKDSGIHISELPSFVGNTQDILCKPCWIKREETQMSKDYWETITQRY